MNVKDVEKEIYKHMKEIRRLHREVCTSDDYLSLCVSHDGEIMFNNSYWKLPKKEQIHFYKQDKKQTRRTRGKRWKRQCIGLVIFAAICVTTIVLIWRAVGTKEEPSGEKTFSEKTTIHPTEFVQSPVAPTATPALFKSNFTDKEITMAAKTVWGEARGVESQMEQAAVVWCALNRYDKNGGSLAGIFTAPHQFHYDESFQTVDDYGRDLIELATDVVSRWEREKNGETNVGRVLPSKYIYFRGDGSRNNFRDDYNFNGNIWDWSLPNPYEN